MYVMLWYSLDSLSPPGKGTYGAVSAFQDVGEIYVCIYIYIYIYTHVFVYICMYVCMYLSLSLYIYIYIYTPIYRSPLARVIAVIYQCRPRKDFFTVAV